MMPRRGWHVPTRHQPQYRRLEIYCGNPAYRIIAVNGQRGGVSCTLIYGSHKHDAASGLNSLGSTSARKRSYQQSNAAWTFRTKIRLPSFGLSGVPWQLCRARSSSQAYCAGQHISVPPSDNRPAVPISCDTLLGIDCMTF